MIAPEDDLPQERHRRNPAAVLGLALLLWAVGDLGDGTARALGV